MHQKTAIRGKSSIILMTTGGGKSWEGHTRVRLTYKKIVSAVGLFQVATSG